jgi:hypothetical protein
MLNIIAGKFRIVSDNDFPHSVVNRTPQLGFRSPSGSLGLYPAIGELEDQWPVPISKSSRKNFNIEEFIPDVSRSRQSELAYGFGVIDWRIALRKFEFVLRSPEP